ncbi:MAG: hypothetical protein AAF661_02055 [Pseudomonadota bacterium]
MELTSAAALWWAVVGLGAYHGLNPGMGWPLAVSAALMERKASALPRALLVLAGGHALAMMAILLPFSAIAFLTVWEREIRIGAGLIVMALGVYLLFQRGHPRFLARVSPAKLGLWSFLSAIAHGAGLMLAPIYLGICAIDADAGHKAAFELMSGNVMTALLVATAHTAAMAAAGGILAVAVYYWLGLKFLSMAWFNLDAVWALSLILVGAFGAWSAL